MAAAELIPPLADSFSNGVKSRQGYLPDRQQFRKSGQYT